MLKYYTRIHEDIPDDVKGAIEEMEHSPTAADSYLAEHLKAVSMSGQTTREFFQAEIQVLEKSIRRFLDAIGGGDDIEDRALDEPLCEGYQKELVNKFNGEVDEIIIVSLYDLMSTAGFTETEEMLSERVIGGIGLRDIRPEIVQSVDPNQVAIRVQGWIPDAHFG